MSTPKDYAEPIDSRIDFDNSNTISSLVWLSMTMIGAFFIPVTTLVILLILKLVEISDGR